MQGKSHDEHNHRANVISEMHPLYHVPQRISWMSNSAHPHEDPAGYKNETVKTTTAEKVPQISKGKGDPHSFNTTLFKRNTSAILTVCLATALGKSTKAWGDFLMEKKERLNRKIHTCASLKFLCKAVPGAQQQFGETQGCWNRGIKWAEVQMVPWRFELKQKRCHIKESRETTF